MNLPFGRTRARDRSRGHGGVFIAPVWTVAPVISGTFGVGQTLSATAGTVTGTPTPTQTYQWTRDGVNIASATAATYVQVHADIGAAIRRVTTATNAAGSAVSTSNALQYLPALATGEFEWFDPTVLTPGAVASLLGKILGATLAQGTGANQPTYSATGLGGTHPGITYDGTADFLSTAGLGATINGTSGVTVIMALIDTTTATKVIYEYSINSTLTAGGFGFIVNDVGGAGFAEALDFNTTLACSRFTEAFATVKVVTICFDQSGVNAATAIRINGVATAITNTNTKTGGGTFTSQSLFLGARSGAVLPAPMSHGHIVFRAGVVVGADLDNAERFVGNKAGVSW